MKDFKWLNEKADISFSVGVIDNLSKFADNKDVGGRSAGSPAEHEAADYLVQKFKEAGLSNVTKDPCDTDTWIFKEASLRYKDKEGKEKRVFLGGYAANADCKDKQFEMVYAGKGTEADLKETDVKDKLVLIDIDQNGEWWINYPLYELAINGAEGVICVNVGGCGQEADNVLVSQDICGPADTMAFSIGKADASELKALMADSETGEIEVLLTADSKVSEGGVSYNIWGDIPGKTDEVIYVLNHYDSYYYTVFDDVQGIGWALGIAKMLTDNGYVPNKTIRFVAHGSEEWGLIDCKNDWAVGAYRQITEVRPEWGKTGFAVVNLDGFYAVKGETKYCIVCTKELYDFADKSVKAFGNTGNYDIEVNLDITSSTEDFSYARAGIPGIVAGAYDGCLADRKVLHSSDSSWDAGFDMEAFEMFHRLFAHIIIDLDSNNVCPMNLQRRVEDAYESAGEYLSVEQKSVFGNASTAIRKLNEAVADANDKNDEADRAGRLNKDIHDIYREMMRALVRLDWNDEMIAPHERYIANIEALRSAKQCIEENDPEGAAEALGSVDCNYYARFFSTKTAQFFEEQVTKRATPSWGTGLVEDNTESMYDTMKSLLAGNCGDAEVLAVTEAMTREITYLGDSIAAEVKALQAITNHATRIIEGR